MAGLDNMAMGSLDAAAWIAKKNRDGRIQLARFGDELQVVGTDSYVLVSSLIPCQFDSWPDGASVTFINDGGAADKIETLVKSLRKYMIRKVALTIEIDDFNDYELQMMGTNAAGFSNKLCIVLRTTSRINLEKFENMLDCQPEGHVAMSDETLESIGTLVKKARCYCASWIFNDRDPLHAFDIRRHDGKAYIIAMPVRAE